MLEDLLSQCFHMSAAAIASYGVVQGHQAPLGLLLGWESSRASLLAQMCSNMPVKPKGNIGERSLRQIE
jgi:hypothetical protein